MEVNEPSIQTVDATGSDIVKLSYNGIVAIKSVNDWIALIDDLDRVNFALSSSNKRVRELERYIADVSIDNFKKRHLPK